MASKGRNLAKLIVNDSGRQENTVLDGDYVKLPIGTTAERPTGVAGYIRFNTDEASLEQFDGTSWTEMAKPPIISTLSYSGSATAVGLDGGETITISGTNFTAGVNVQFGTTWATAVTRTNSTSLSVTVPALIAGDYDVVVINGDGMQATLTDGLSVNAAPVFTTAAGSLGEIQNDQAITTITLVATEDDSGAITYAVTTGSLPTGLSLSEANITGTPTGYTAETTVNFTITATDDENQTVSRNFSLTVLYGFYDYEITNAVKFDPTLSTPSHLDRTPSANGNNTTFTLSLWVKRSKISSTQQFYSSRVDNSNGFFAYFGGNDQMEFYYPAYSYVSVTTTTAVYRDVGAWYHIVYAVDTTQATSSDRAKLYVNGELVTDRTGAYPRQNEEQFYHRSGVKQTIGTNPDQSYGTDGYIANVYSIDGQQLAASDFGEYKNDVWVAKEYTGTYGSQGFHLDFSNSSNIGEDQSGNNNDFAYDTVSADVLVPDTPTNNFSTLSSIDNPLGTTLTLGNLKSTPPNYTDNDVYNTMGMSSGKWYFEVYIAYKGAHGNVSISDSIGDTSGYGSNYSYYHFNGGIGTSGTDNGNGDALITGDILTCCFDADNGAVYWNRNAAPNTAGTAQSTGMSTDVIYRVKFKENGNPRTTTVFNFGQDSSFGGSTTAQGNTDSGGKGDFYYTPPTGFKALCNENLPKDDTFELNQGEKPSDHFEALTYSGNSSTQSITGLSFQPDLVWIKSRNGVRWHQIFDVNRGVGNFSSTDQSNADIYDVNTLSSFNSNGFSLGTSNRVNGSGENYAAWCWKAGGTPVSNTDGSITSSVSANTSAGFSIVTYTGNGTAGATIGHGLNSAPDVIICKNRDATSKHDSYFSVIGPAYRMVIQDGGGYSPSSTVYWNNTAPTSSVFTVGNGLHTNGSGNDLVAYCWHSVPGFSKFGEWTGNGNANGPFIFTGFKPAFLLYKDYNNPTDWVLMDNKRDVYNPANHTLWANTDGTEATPGDMKIDFVSNGIKIRATSTQTNGSSNGPFLYMAFAEDPFKYGNAR